MNKHRVISMAVILTMIAMMLAPGSALAASSSISASKTTAAPGEQVTITISLSLEDNISTCGGEISSGGLEVVSQSASGFGSMSVRTSASGFAGANLGSSGTTGGSGTYTVRVPSNASDGAEYTLSLIHI